jgi:hypothetical protein
VIPVTSENPDARLSPVNRHLSGTTGGFFGLLYLAIMKICSGTECIGLVSDSAIM